MSNRHRESRLRGYALEWDLWRDLRNAYPTVTWRVGKKSIFDIYSDIGIAVDFVSIDKQGRLNTGHKENCIHHIEEANRLGLVGYIAFLYNDVYMFLPITSTYLTKHGRPKVTGLLLRSCFTDVVSPSYKRSIIVSGRYIDKIKQEIYENSLRSFVRLHATTPLKEPHLIQEQRMKIIYDRAWLQNHKHDIV